MFRVLGEEQLLRLQSEFGFSHRLGRWTDQFIGLDVSLKDTFISVREGGQRIWRGKCPSDPKLIAEVVRKRAPNVERVVFETGPLPVWFYHPLTLEGLPASALMPVMPRRLWIWRGTRTTRTTRTAAFVHSRHRSSNSG